MKDLSKILFVSLKMRNMDLGQASILFVGGYWDITFNVNCSITKEVMRGPHTLLNAYLLSVHRTTQYKVD